MKKKIKISNSLRYGSVSLIMMVVVLAIIVIVNLAINALPSKYTSYTNDVNGLYDISKTSRDYMQSLDDEITVYVVAVDNASDEHHLIIEEYVRRYSELSSKITVKHIDPELYPNFLSTYIEKEEINEYKAEDLDTAYTHVIVESDKHSMIIPYANIFAVSSSITSSEDLEQFYYTYGYVPYDFKLENQLLSAIDFVTTDTVPSIYYVSGHGEATLNSAFSEFAKLENLTLKELKLGEEKSIPDDAKVVIIFAPTSDYTSDEIEKLKEYADKGGNIVVSTGYSSVAEKKSLTNLRAFLTEYYGLEYLDAKVYEGSTSKIWGKDQSAIKPAATEKTNKVLTGVADYLYMSNCHGINISETMPSGVNAYAILTTSSSGYAKTVVTKDTQNKKEDGDLSGTFILGAVSERTSGESVSKLWWYSSNDALSYYTDLDSIYIMAGVGPQTANSYLSIFTLTESVEKESSVSIPAVTILHDMLDMSDEAADVWSWIIIAIVPGAILAYGIYVRYRRVRR